MKFCLQYFFSFFKKFGFLQQCSYPIIGHSCEKCVTGYYGDAKGGTEQDCKACACPGGLFARNQFARKCVLNEKGADTPYRCLQCDKGKS